MWNTNLADAHVKVQDNYAHLEEDQNVLSEFGNKKVENGTIYTGVNPKAARVESGGTRRTIAEMSPAPIRASFDIKEPVPDQRASQTKVSYPEDRFLSPNSQRPTLGGILQLPTAFNRGEELLKKLGGGS